MHRRALIGSLGTLVAGGAAGCLESADGGSETDDSDSGNATGTHGTDEWPDPGEYERCPRLLVDADVLPEPARREVETALADGSYETTEEPYLPHLLDPAESYLEVDGTYYRVDVATDGDATRLALVETAPSKGSYSVAVRNGTDGELQIDCRITRPDADETVLSASQSVGAGERSTLGEYARTLGRYRAEIDAGEFAETLTWREEEHVDPLDTIVVEDGDAYPEPRAVADLVSCQDRWDE